MTEETNDFIYSDVTELDKSFDGLAAGTWVSRTGESVVFAADDFQAFVDNTNAALASTKDASGDIVGFPIDEDAHDHKGGAGWIVGVELDGEKIRFIPKWTEKGRELIEKNVRRYFSPTVNLAKKVILGGSLTNYPASRFSDGRMALRPIELSEQLYTVELSDGLMQTIKKAFYEIVGDLAGKNKPTMEVDKNMEIADVKEFAKTDEGKEYIASLVEAKAENRAAELAEAKIAKARIEAGIVEFAEQVTEGEDKALPLEKGRVVAFLEKLPPEMVEEAQAIMSEILANGTLDFSAKGHSRTLLGKNDFPEWAAPMLREWVGNGNTVKDFFVANAAELGAQEDYNLTEFVEK